MLDKAHIQLPGFFDNAKFVKLGKEPYGIGAVNSLLLFTMAKRLSTKGLSRPCVNLTLTRSVLKHLLGVTSLRDERRELVAVLRPQPLLRSC